MVDEPPTEEGEDAVISRHRTSSDATTTGIASSPAISPEGKPDPLLPVDLSASFLQLQGQLNSGIQIPKSTARSVLPSTVRAVISPALKEVAIRTLQCTLLMTKVNAQCVLHHAVLTVLPRLSPSPKLRTSSPLPLYDLPSFVWHLHWRPLMHGTCHYLPLQDQILMLLLSQRVYSRLTSFSSHCSNTHSIDYILSINSRCTIPSGFMPVYAFVISCIILNSRMYEFNLVPDMQFPISTLADAGICLRLPFLDQICLYWWYPSAGPWYCSCV